MLLATKVGDVMEGSTTIDFENGYQIELTNMNLRLCYNYQDEGKIANISVINNKQFNFLLI